MGAGAAAGDKSTMAPGRRQMRVSVRVCEITHSISWLDVRIGNRLSHFMYVTVEHMAIICVRVRMLLESRTPTHTKKSAPLLSVSDVPEQTSPTRARGAASGHSFGPTSPFLSFLFLVIVVVI